MNNSQNPAYNECRLQAANLEMDKHGDTHNKLVVAALLLSGERQSDWILTSLASLVL